MIFEKFTHTSRFLFQDILEWNVINCHYSGFLSSLSKNIETKSFV